MAKEDAIAEFERRAAKAAKRQVELLDRNGRDLAFIPPVPIQEWQARVRRLAQQDD